MTATMPSLSISITIERPLAKVYQFASLPENFPKWASGLASGLTQKNGEWIAQTPEGSMRVQFSPQNPFGILDHYVLPSAGVSIYIPLRVIANGSGSEVILTLFRLPDMSDEKFAADADWVRRDLNTLKQLLEAQH